MIQFEFSLALNNRTGKYFMCRDILDHQPIIDQGARYWRLKLAHLPTGFLAKILGKLMSFELEARASYGFLNKLIPRMSTPDPVLFTDPLQVSLYALKRSDIVLCHDLGPITHQQFYAPGVRKLYELSFDIIARVKPHLVFVSLASQQEFEKLYGHRYSSAEVIPCSLPPQAFDGPAQPVEGVSKPFLLTVGAVGARKNQAAVIRAFETTGLAAHNVQLVIAGGPEPGYQEVADAARGVRGVRLLGYVSSENLRWLYRNTIGFVLASRLEGFGMPAAEAVLQGAVPMVSANSVLAEVAGPSAVLVDPDSAASLEQGLKTLVEMDSDDRERRVSAAGDNLSAFSEHATRMRWQQALARLARLSV